jgi:hypothetical protein
MAAPKLKSAVVHTISGKENRTHLALLVGYRK